MGLMTAPAYSGWTSLLLSKLIPVPLNWNSKRNTVESRRRLVYFKDYKILYDRLKSYMYCSHSSGLPVLKLNYC